MRGGITIERLQEILIESMVRPRVVPIRRYIDCVEGSLGAFQMDQLIARLSKLDIVRGDFDYDLVRATMAIVFFVFGCQKWFDYEANALVPFISHGPLIFWLYPAFGIRGAAFFLGCSEWLFGCLIVIGFWNRKIALLASLASCATYVATVTIIPFFPEAWAEPAGGFPAATLPFLFLMKDIVLLAAAVYMLKQALLRANASERRVSLGVSEREVIQ
jgi:uncharacterized membrane protein YkgB